MLSRCTNPCFVADELFGLHPSCLCFTSACGFLTLKSRPSSLVLQRSKDLVSSTNAPTVSVLVMLRIGVTLGFLASKWTAQLRGHGMRNKGQNATRGLLIINQRGTSREGNAQAKTAAVLRMLQRSIEDHTSNLNRARDAFNSILTAWRY